MNSFSGASFIPGCSVSGAEERARERNASGHRKKPMSLAALLLCLSFGDLVATGGIEPPTYGL